MGLDLKKAGLSIAEDTVKAVLKDIVRPFAAEYIAASGNKIDDLILPFLDQLELALLDLADKMDGEKG